MGECLYYYHYHTRVNFVCESGACASGAVY